MLSLRSADGVSTHTLLLTNVQQMLASWNMLLLKFPQVQMCLCFWDFWESCVIGFRPCVAGVYSWAKRIKLQTFQSPFTILYAKLGPKHGWSLCCMYVCLSTSSLVCVNVSFCSLMMPAATVLRKMLSISKCVFFVARGYVQFELVGLFVRCHLNEPLCQCNLLALYQTLVQWLFQDAVGNLPSRELTHPTLGIGKSFAKVPWDGTC